MASLSGPGPNDPLWALRLAGGAFLASLRDTGWWQQEAEWQWLGLSHVTSPLCRPLGTEVCTLPHR